MIVYRTTDRVPLKIGKLTLWVSPLSALQKAEVLSHTKIISGVEVADNSKMALYALKHCVKKIDGLNGTKYADGSKLELSFEDDGSLDDDSLTAVMQIIDYSKTTAIAAQLLTKGIDGIDVKGVKVDAAGVVHSKKKG